MTSLGQRVNNPSAVLAERTTGQRLKIRERIPEPASRSSSPGLSARGPL
jgi:hypothetical protein